MRHIRLLTALFLLTSLSIGFITQTANAQADTIIQVEEMAFIEQSGISAELGNLLPELKRIGEIAKATDELWDLDSLTQESKIYYDPIGHELRKNLNSYSLHSLENKRSEWISYAQLVSSYENRLRNRMDLLNKENSSLNSTSQLWKNTKSFIEESETGKELLDDILIVTDSVQILTSRLNNEIDELLRIQKSLSELKQAINEDIALIESAINASRLSIFGRSHPPIWNSIDSTSAWSNFSDGIRKSLRENNNVLTIYFEANLNKGIIYVIIFILLVLLFSVVRHHRQIYFKENTIMKKQAEIILNNPIISALALSILIFSFMFLDRPRFVTILMAMAVTVPIYMVIPRIFESRRIKLVLYFLISLYFLDVLQFLLPPSSFYIRMILFTENLLLMWCFYELYQARKELFSVSKFWGKIVNKTAMPVIYILGLAFFANFFGFLSLSQYLVAALYGIAYAGLLITLIAIILYVFIIFLVEFRVDKGMDRQIGVNILRRVLNIIKIGAIILWIRVILVIIGLFNPMMKWYRMLMDTSWTIGAGEISLGGLISFIVILVITFLINRWVRNFFMLSYVIKSRLPKGIPAAVSMISRYVIVIFGIYIALSAAGVDLGRFGLIAGALGVGIGFGLQNVVYNLIAGLIITLERPIHVGDIVEVENLMGKVTEIGVRSSKVKTFDGSEVIVPNGNIISNQVINWTLSDQKRRLKILVKTEMGVNPRTILKIMVQEARKHKNTLKSPEPLALFNGYGSSSLDFTLYFWVYFDVGFTTRSDVALAIYDSLEKEGIGLPVPTQKYYKGDLPPHDNSQKGS